MEDETGLDSKVVVSPTGRDGRPLYQLTVKDRAEIGEYFRKYKHGEAGKFAKVPGWGSTGEGRAYVLMTHAFFKECRTPSGSCRVAVRPWPRGTPGVPRAESSIRSGAATDVLARLAGRE
jgi:hypothetical protein